jgi:hypothetical protein
MRNKKRTKRNSSRKNQNGGRVSLPLEYFGCKTNNYHATGSDNLKNQPHANGNTIATSFGTSHPELAQSNSVGPSLGPPVSKSNNCSVQTGGGRRKVLRAGSQNKRRKASYAKSRKKSTCRKSANTTRNHAGGRRKRAWW